MRSRAAVVALLVLSLAVLVQPAWCDHAITPSIVSLTPDGATFHVSVPGGTVLVSGLCTIRFTPTGTAGEIYSDTVTGWIILGGHEQDASWLMVGSIDPMGMGTQMTFSVGNSWSFAEGTYSDQGMGWATTGAGKISGFTVAGPVPVPTDPIDPGTPA